MFSEKLFIRLRNASSIAVLTGAGISAESGLPTFRGKDGLWNDKKIEELATVESMKKDPEQFWQFYSERRSKLKEARPNLGHYALVDFERYFDEFTVITQNIDDLHRRAGTTNVIELHGNIYRDRCMSCGHIQVPQDNRHRCEKCGERVRPDVVLYGENLDEKNLKKAQEAAAVCEVFFSIGTSSVVEPAASLPYLAKANGAYLVEINTEQTPLSIHANESLRGATGKILPQMAILLDKLFSRR
jgi:NAD-dependent deacetylase